MVVVTATHGADWALLVWIGRVWTVIGVQHGFLALLWRLRALCPLSVWPRPVVVRRLDGWWLLWAGWSLSVRLLSLGHLFVELTSSLLGWCSLIWQSVLAFPVLCGWLLVSLLHIWHSWSVASVRRLLAIWSVWSWTIRLLAEVAGGRRWAQSWRWWT